VPEDLDKLKWLKAEESRGYRENDYFLINDVRQKIVMIEKVYHQRLDAERAAEWGRMPPHP
jgi:hypothetical protein